MKTQLLGAWSGPVGIVLFGLAIGPLVAGFLPPPAPTMGAAEVAELFRLKANAIRLASILLLCAAGFFCAFVATISAQLRRIEGPSSPLAYTQLVAGAMVIFPFILAPQIWAVAAYRPERAADQIMLLNDLGWIILIMPSPLGMAQLVAIALAVLGDRRPQPILPRWIGYFNLWMAILFLPGCLVVFFQRGPFAWDGLLAFWVPAIAFGIWALVMCAWMIRAIRREQADRPPLASPLQ